MKNLKNYFKAIQIVTILGVMSIIPYCTKSDFVKPESPLALKMLGLIEMAAAMGNGEVVQDTCRVAGFRLFGVTCTVKSLDHSALAESLERNSWKRSKNASFRDLRHATYSLDKIIIIYSPTKTPEVFDVSAMRYLP